MNESELALLVGRSADGDNEAFGRLAEAFYSSLSAYLRRFIDHHEDIEDLLQETFLSAYLAMRKGKYTHINQAALAGWFRRIAWHLLIRNRNRNREEPEVTGEIEETLDVAQSGDAADGLDVARLYAFLDRQFDEILIESQPTADGRRMGLLKKLAFLRFYVDGLSQKETADVVQGYAARIGLRSSVDQAAINNWIARGDVLRTLVRHLVDEHRETLSKLACSELACHNLAGREREALHLHWALGKTLGTIAESTGLSLPEVEKALHDARRKIAESLFRMIKSELHESRFHGRQGRDTAM
jgi:RNA polymerase sigma factor (sigma-70 family)